MEQENQEMKPRHHSIGSNLLFFFRYYRKEEPIVIWGAMGSILMGTLAPFLGIYLPKIALDLVIRRADMKEAIPVLGLSMIALVLAHGIWRLSQMGMYYYYNGQNTNLIALLVLKNLRIPYEYVESGAYRTLYAKAMEACMNGDWSAGSRMVDGTIHIAAGTLCFVLYSGVIGKLSCWMLVIILMLSLINYYLGIRKMRYEERMREEQARADRHYWSLRQSMGNVKGAKDIRIFGMSRWMHDLRERVLREQLTVKEKLYRNASFYEKLGFLLKAGKDLGAYGYLLCRACRGEIQAGEFVLYFGAITGFSGFLEEMISSFNTIRSAANSTDYLRAYLDLPEEKRQMGNRHVRELSTPIEISFRDVSFSYWRQGFIWNPIL